MFSNKTRRNLAAARTAANNDDTAGIENALYETVREGSSEDRTKLTAIFSRRIAEYDNPTTS